MSRIPLILYGDGPRLSSGLARIARDLAMRLAAEEDALGIRFLQVGVDYPAGVHWRTWDFCGFQPAGRDQGREAVARMVATLQKEEEERPIVLMIMDPSRCYDLTRYAAVVEDADEVQAKIDAAFWGYFPLDAQNRLGGVGGPAKRAILDTDRLLAYGRYGVEVLEATRGIHDDDATEPIPFLPHGLDTTLWKPGIPWEDADPQWLTWAQAQPATALRIGCVATNQPRKDLGLYFSAVAELKAQGHPVACWLHTDRLTHAWDIGELAYTCGLQRHEVAVSASETGELTDRQLAAQYAWSHATFAPGLGEGFGYPIVESLACGTPVVHGHYAGGVELIPQPEWLVEPCAWRLEGMYALLRPVFKPSDVAERLLTAGRQKSTQPAYTQRFCAESVTPLDWTTLWPRWRAWVVEGLDVRRKGAEG